MSALKKRQEQKQHTKQIILDAAIRVFTEHGIIATKTSDIAKAAQLAHGSVFAHFHTREELVEQVIAEMGGKITAHMQALLQQGTSVEEILHVHIDGLCEHEPFYTQLVREGPLLPEIARRTLVVIQSAIAHYLHEAMRQEIKKGSMRSLPLDLVFNTWIGLVHHYLLNADLFTVPGKGSVLKQRGNKLIRYYLDLINQ